MVLCAAIQECAFSIPSPLLWVRLIGGWNHIHCTPLKSAHSRVQQGGLYNIMSLGKWES